MPDLPKPTASEPATAAAAMPVRVRGELPADGGLKFSQIFKPHAKSMVLGMVILVVTNLIMLVLPRLTKEGIDLIEGTELDDGSVLQWISVQPTVTAVAIGIITLAIGGGIFRVLSRIVLFNVGRDVEHDLRRDLFSHLSMLSQTFYMRMPTGDVMSRLTNDLTNVRLMAGFALLNTMNAVIIFAGNLPLLFRIDWRVAIFALLPFPLVMALAQLLAKAMYARTRKNQEALANLTTHVQENLAGQGVVRAFSQQDAERDRFGKTNDEAYAAAMELAVIRLIMFPLMGLMGSLGVAITLYVGGLAVIDGRVTVGDISEFTQRLLMMTWPAIAFGFIVSVYQRGRAGLDRINEILNERPDIVDGDHVAVVEGALRAEGLSVRYPEADRPALQDVNFQLTPGGVLGVVGKSGGGKTTLVRALARMLVVERGELFVDDVDINDWDLRSLASGRGAGGIAVVPQDGFLFSATLRENLVFGRPDASDEEVAAALKIADLERDIAAFPKELDTLVGERGVTLSGGQRQRVSLARALLAKPRLLILDDCLSAVDAETEANIVSALRAGAYLGGAERGEEAASAVTLVIISHRLSAVRSAEEILVLEDGAVIERGTHDALLEEDGRYADLWGRERLLEKLAEDA